MLTSKCIQLEYYIEDTVVHQNLTSSILSACRLFCQAHGLVAYFSSRAARTFTLASTAKKKKRRTSKLSQLHQRVSLWGVRESIPPPPKKNSPWGHGRTGSKFFYVIIQIIITHNFIQNTYTSFSFFSFYLICLFI